MSTELFAERLTEVETALRLRSGHPLLLSALERGA